jgi:TonB family protein
VNFGPASLFLAIWLLVANVDAQTSKKRQPSEPAQRYSKASICTGGILNMKAVHLPAPLYPPEARNTVRAGTLTVMVEVNEQGNVTSARACSGHQMLRSFVEDAARQARIKPTELSGHRVKIRGVLNYRFDPQRSYTEPVLLYCGPSMKIIKVLNGYAIDLVKPDRPAGVKDNIGTAVSVLVSVDEAGKVEKAKAVSGDPHFRPKAEDAAKRSIFRRFMRCGKPTKLSSIVVYNFPRP